MNKTAPTRWITLSERIYATLMILYPAEYRREYERLMLQLFRDVLRERYHRQGVIGVVLWWCMALRDLTFSVIEQRRKGQFVMSKATLIQLTGSILVVGGAFCALAAFSQLQPDDHYTYYGIYQLLMWLSAPAFLLIGIGCIGLGLRHDRIYGLTLYLSGIGALVTAVGIVGSQVQPSLWNIFYVGGVLHTIGLTLFGLLHLRAPTLPVFRGLPFQIASGLIVLLTGILRTDSLTANNLISFLMFFGMGIAWLAIGMTLHRQQSTAPLTASREV